MRAQQDEELALLLQEQERRRRGAGGPAMDTVELDARLAKIIAEQEQLQQQRYERRIQEKQSRLSVQVRFTQLLHLY